VDLGTYRGCGASSAADYDSPLLARTGLGLVSLTLVRRVVVATMRRRIECHPQRASGGWGPPLRAELVQGSEGSFGPFIGPGTPKTSRKTVPEEGIEPPT
jgi:hypothetical protein